MTKLCWYVNTFNNEILFFVFLASLIPGFRIGSVTGARFHAEVKKLREFAQIQILKYRNTIQEHFPDTVKISCPKGGYSLWIVGQ